MRADVDFESYAAARWHPVVWTLALLGVPPGHAATLAREALAQRRSEWSHQDAFDDLDAPVARVTGADLPMPYSKPLEQAAFPHEEHVVQAAIATFRDL